MKHSRLFCLIRSCKLRFRHFFFSAAAKHQSGGKKKTSGCIYSLFQLPFSSALLVIFVILICLIVHHIEQGVFILEIHHLRTVILQVHIEIAL